MVIDTEHLRGVARAAGASGFGVTSSAPFVEARRRLTDHRASGLSGSLHFTYDDPKTATDVSTSFPWARSLVVFGQTYPTKSPSAVGAVVARFADRDHYVGARKIAAALVATLEASGYRAEALIDDNRLVDRSAGARAGLGWLGKSTMLLSPLHGPWFLAGSVVTDADLQVTPAMSRTCGTCVACIPACPTDAITSEGLDARRCIAAWLQSPGSLPLWIRPHIGRRIYGCDDCLTSCPPGHKAMTDDAANSESLPFEELLGMTDQGLVDRFHWWYVPRRDGRYLRRNLVVAAGNAGEPAAENRLRDHLEHPSSMIRGHAAWALARSAGDRARSDLERALARETVADSTEEIEHALSMVSAT